MKSCVSSGGIHEGCRAGKNGGGFEVFGRPILKKYIRFSSLFLLKIIYACERGGGIFGIQ